MADLKTKKGVEIFSVGNWNGTDISSDDLDEMIRAFEENKNYQLPLKLGHTPDQKLLQNDGLPAAGWIEKVYRKGEKLIADFKDIPAKIYQLIENGAYRQVSSEVWFNVTVGDKKYKKMLSGVALLGADLPGVMNLNDMLAMYGHKGYESLSQIVKDVDQTKTTIHYFVMERKTKMEKTPLEIKLEQELADQKALFTKTQEQVNTEKSAREQLEKEAQELRTFKVEQEKRNLEADQALKTAKLESFITEMKSVKYCTPSMEPYVKELLSEEKQNYTIKVNDKEEKKFDSKQDLFKECMKLFSEASKVNFEESSDEGESKGDKLTEKEIVEKVEKYAAEHKVSFKEARRALKIEMPKAAKI